MTKATGLLCHPKVARIHELAELGRLVIEPDVRIRRVGGGFPKVSVSGKNMSLLGFEMTRRIAAVTVRATENHILFGFMHRLDALMTFQAANAFRISLGLGLIDPVSRR